MSLFKVRDWWSTKCGTEEEFDKGCLCVGNIDNQSTNQKDYSDKVLTGSFSGILRIYKPQRNKFQVSDLLLEQQLEGPIIQMAIGRFMVSSQSNALAVLMPRKLVVFSVTSSTRDLPQDSETSSEDQSGLSQCDLTRLYEHDLSRLSYNFTYGPFGGTYGKDFFCVQSFDGQLAFYEQDHFVFARFMSDTLLPGPLLYNKNTDSFITYNSNMELESYKYQVLATSSGSNEKDSSSSGKKVQVDWSLNLGEEILDIQVARYGQNLSTSQNEIIVLGTRTLYSIKENGKLAAQKKLDFFPSTLFVYNQSLDRAAAKQNLMIATHNRTVMIYRDPKLIWAAGTSIVPVSLQLGTFVGIKSMIVMLDDQGNLSVNYLGTDAVSNPVPTMESKEIDYGELEDEHRKLQSLIRQTQNAGKFEPTDKLLIRAQVPNSIDQEVYSSGVEQKKKVTVKLYLGYTGDNVSLSNICLNVSVQPPFSVAQSTIQIESLQGGSHRTPVIIPITIYGGSQIIPTTLTAEVLAVFNAPTGELRTTSCEFLLPMSLAGDVISPKKTGTTKITIDTNRMPPPMSALFEDVLHNVDAEKVLAGGSVLTFKYSNGQDATILVSKTSGRYRIQSNDLETLWILTSELIRRVDTYFLSIGQEDDSPEPYSMTFTENLPFQQYFQKIDDHFEQRVSLKSVSEKLRNYTHQLRAIQKRLLVRFKDRNPTPINNWDILLDQTYETTIELSKEVERCQESLEVSRKNLSCCTSLILALLKLKLQLPDQEIAILTQYLSPNIVDTDDHGWEEVTEAGMTYLLRTVLSKSTKDNNTMPSPLEIPRDTSKLKKHIALVYDRISKGMSLTQDKKKKKKKKVQNEQDT